MKTMIPDLQTEPRERAPGRQPDRPSRVTIVVVLLVLALVALVLGRAALDRPTPAAREPVAAATPELPTPLATAAPAEVDFLSVVRGIVQVSNDLRIHPDPSRLAEYMESGNPAYGDALSGQSQLLTGALRYDPAPATPTVSAVRVLSRDGDFALLSVAFDSLPRYRVVDRQGQVVSDSSASSGVTVQWRLHFAGGTWRLVGTPS